MDLAAGQEIREEREFGMLGVHGLYEMGERESREIGTT